jgi:hypothetical protein
MARKRRKAPSKAELIRELNDAGLGFTANVCINHQRKPTTKLRNLVKLVRRGCTVYHAPFEISEIVVDGRQYSLSYLDALC